MRTSKLVHLVHCHAEGEVGDVIVGGVAPPPGDTIWAQSRWIAENGELRDFLLNEPRGGVFRHINLLVPPKDPRADAAWIIMEPEDTPPMSGSNSICVATVLLETGILPMREPETLLRLEAPGGLVEARASCENGRVTRVRIRNVASFATALDAQLEVEGIGKLRVDIAFGGDSFVLIDASDLGLRLVPDEARSIASIGRKIVTAANRQIGFRHPGNADWRHISFCQLTAPIALEGNRRIGLNAVAIKPGKLDRSPCGTGCSARLAVMHAKGEAQVGDTFVGRSIIGSEFDCRIESAIDLGGIPAIVPSLSGRGFITGTSQITLDPFDPWPRGYRLSDTWPQLEE